WAIERRYGVARAAADRVARTTELRAAPPSLTRQTAVLAVAHGRLALCRSGAALRLPLEEGGGEDACRRAMRRVFGNVEGEVRLLGGVAAPLVGDAAADRGTTDETSRLTLSELRVPTLPAKTLDAARPAADQFINGLLSALEFNARVLALAEDPGTPLLARLRFLAIFSTNLDQFFMVDVGAMKHQVARGIVERSPDGLTPAEQLDAIAMRLRRLVARESCCFRVVAG